MKRLTQEEFLKKAYEIYGDDYDYSETIYVDTRTKITVICPKHGKFTIRPNNHISQHQGCKLCGYECVSGLKKKTYEQFVEEAKEKHKDKYTYVKDSFVDMGKEMDIVCPIHGCFGLSPTRHLQGTGCPDCAGNKRLTTEEFISKAKNKHGNKYIYTKVNYKGNKVKVTIICPEHGEFPQLPNDHLDGHGCPFCRKWKLEASVVEILKSKGINFIRQAHFKWLGRQSLDFYLPDYNIAIECQGIQHFEPRDFSKRKNEQDSYRTFLDNQKRDKKKFLKCKEQGIDLIYYSDLKNYHQMFDNEMLDNKTLKETIDKWRI